MPYATRQTQRLSKGAVVLAPIGKRSNCLRNDRALISRSNLFETAKPIRIVVLCARPQRRTTKGLQDDATMSESQFGGIVDSASLKPAERLS
jgi:hypothetical protein